MTNEELGKELQKLKEKFSRVLMDFQDSVAEVNDVFERYECVCNSITATSLNTLITFGFVPNAKLKFRDKMYTFVGYTESLGMMFMDEKGNNVNSGNADMMLKHLAEWTKE